MNYPTILFYLLLIYFGCLLLQTERLASVVVGIIIITLSIGVIILEMLNYLN